MGYTQEQVKAKNKMIETVPSTAGSTPYFNPSTQRFHDPMTKRMVKTPAAYKSTMNPDVLKPMQGSSGSTEETGMLIGVLSNMKESLNELVTLTKKSLGLEENEEKRGRERRKRDYTKRSAAPGRRPGHCVRSSIPPSHIPFLL